MTITDTLTKLPISEFARLMGVNPLHFWGVQIDEIQNTACDRTWFRHNWQGADRLGREELTQAIAQAESDLEALLGYRLLATWEVDEWNPTVRANRPELVNINLRDVRGFGQNAPARWGHLITGGIRAQELIEAAVVITYGSTQTPTDWEDTATITVVTTVVDPAEIAVYYPGEGGAEGWRVKPITVVIALGTATITIPREMLVDPGLFDALVPAAVPGIPDANFLATVDVYRVYNDPQQQVQMMWEPPGGASCGCDGAFSACANCQYQVQMGCLLLRGDPRNSLVVYTPATWNATTLEFDSVALAVTRQPDILRLFYYAGLRDKSITTPTITMDAQWARTVAILAASRLDRPPCDCASVWWERWTADLSFTSGAEELASYSISPGATRNPLGTRRGEVYAWRQVSREGVRAGRAGIAFA